MTTRIIVTKIWLRDYWLIRAGFVVNLSVGRAGFAVPLVVGRAGFVVPLVVNI